MATISAVSDFSQGRSNEAQVRIAAVAAQLAARLSDVNASAAEELGALQHDIAGRVTKAVTGEDRFNRWGKHYLRALSRAHQLQVCTNFMDRGVQVYGGTLFKAVRQEGDRVFVSLPAPKAAQDETGIPCELCGRTIPFSQFEEHVNTNC